MRNSKEWALNKKEAEILGKDFIEEYYQRVEKYSSKRSSQACDTTTKVGLAGLCAAAAIALLGYTVIDYFLPALPASTHLMIGLTIFSTIAIGTVTLAALITRKAKVDGMQNPKTWKAEILSQKTSNTEGYSQNTSYAFSNEAVAI